MNPKAYRSLLDKIRVSSARPVQWPLLFEMIHVGEICAFRTGTENGELVQPLGPDGARSGELLISQNRVRVVPVVIHHTTILHR